MTRERRKGAVAVPVSILLAVGITQVGDAAVVAGTRTIRVGPHGDVTSIAHAASLARDGDVVEVEAGVYRADTAVWLQRSLTIRSTGGKATLIADGAHAEGKAIWVIRNGDFMIDGFDFVGARVPDRNGAGIRFERGELVVRNSRFLDNETGLLTGNDPSSRLTIEGCEFRAPGEGNHLYHNLYVGLIDRLVVRDSWSHGGRIGHLLKSRARENWIVRNRLVDGVNGAASYELEFPNGGVAQVINNRIEQSPGTKNRVIVSFGAEGYRWTENDLSMKHNVVVNRGNAAAIFVRAAWGLAKGEFVENVWVGRGDLELPIQHRLVRNRRLGAVPVNEGETTLQ